VDSPTLPGVEKAPVVAIPAMQCQVDVAAGAMACSTVDTEQARLAMAANRIFGGQDTNIRLSNTGGSYDTDTGVFEINVTVQNLTQAALGTDGVESSGVDIFFADEPVAYPSGTVTLMNAGTGFFSDANQSYFHYPEVLEPYEISAPRSWQFNVPNGVTRFTFVVYVSAEQVDEQAPLVDKVWTGARSSAWTEGLNWADGVAPNAGSTVNIPADSLLADTASMPVLSSDTALANLRVSGTSTFDLSGYTLTAWGNVDSPGTIFNGTLWLRGVNPLLRGNVPAVVVSGGARLQGATTASAPVSISDGSLSVSGTSLTISLP
jgi:hypothetical protein